MQTVNRWILMATVILVMAGCATHSHATVRAFLGERVVSDRAEYDTIVVDRPRADFTALSLKVRGAPVEFKRVVVHFGNGSKQRFERNVLVRAGAFVPRIDLAGGRRHIDKVVFYYETRSPGRRTATVELYGVR